MAAQTSGRTFRIDAGFFIAALLVFTALIACSRSRQKCTATLDYQGKTYVGVGESKADAEHFACNKYCRDDDPEYEAMYRIWLSSPAGQAAGRPSKDQAIYKEKRLLDYVTITCANKCVGWTKDGKAKVETTCN